MDVILGSRSTERGQEAANDVLSLSGGNLRGATNEETARVGSASGSPMSARAAIYILAGHIIHHVDSLKTTYKVAA